MKDSQFPDTELGNKLKRMVNNASDFYKEYVQQDHGFELVCRIPQEIAHQWLRLSPLFKIGAFNHYMIGEASKDPERGIRWMNKGAIRVDDFEGWEQVWIYNHDGRYYIAKPPKDRR
jgi:hypothetical protein